MTVNQLRDLMNSAIETEQKTTGRSKADIARAAGVHPTSLSQSRPPDERTLSAVLDHLGYDLQLVRVERAG